MLDRPTRPRCGVPLRRQGQDPALLQVFQHAQAGRDPVVALRGGPVQVLADRLGQLVAAESREQGHGFLNIGDLPPRQAAPKERGGREALDPRIHRSGSPREKDMSERVMPCGRWRVNHLTAIPPKKNRTAPESTAWGGRENLTRNRRLTKCHYAALCRRGFAQTHGLTDLREAPECGVHACPLAGLAPKERVTAGMGHNMITEVLIGLQLRGPPE